MATLLPEGKQSFETNAGVPLVGGKLYTYDAGTNNPRVTYQDAAATILNTNPIILDARGEATVFWAGNYKIVLKDSLDNTIWTVDNVVSADTYSASIDASLRADLASKATGSKGAGMVGFDPTLNYAANTIGRSVADREWNPRDFPWLAKFDNVTDDTASIQACWQSLFSAGGGTMVLPRGIAKVTSVVLNYTAGITVNIRGQGQHATYLAKLGATVTPVLDIKSNAGVLDVYSAFADFQVLGANACDGVKLTTIANVSLARIETRVCGVGLNLAGCLVSSFHECSFLSNVVGVQTRLNTAIYCNSLRFYGCNIKANTSLGMDLNHANDMLVWNCDIESNGTSLNLTTGAVITQAGIAAEIGVSTITFGGGTHFEANKGSNFVAVAAAGFNLVFDGVSILSSEAGLATSIQALSSVTMRGVVAASPGDVATIGVCAKSSIEDSNIATITDTSAHQFRKNVTTSAGVTPFSVKTAAIGTGGMTLDSSAKFQGTGAFVQGNVMVTFQDGAAAGNQVNFYQSNGAGGNAAAAAIKAGTNSVTGRSINVGGSFNAGGADYAEYERKSDGCGAFAKGDIVGFDAQGLLTDRWEHAVSFGVKSTQPCMVGGDIWGDGLEGEELEAERVKYDRIAYTGKVPVNTIGAAPGDWIEAAPGPNGSIIASVGVNSDKCIGRVRSVLPDGRPVVAVKGV